jgi:transcriptional regulator with XRE-family HTH domain
MAKQANYYHMGLPADQASRMALAARLRKLREAAPLLPREIKSRKERHAKHGNVRLDGPLTMLELGARCRIFTRTETVGFKKGDISRWESGKRMPSFFHMINIAEALSMGRPVKDRVTLEHITGIPMRAKVIKPPRSKTI